MKLDPIGRVEDPKELDLDPIVIPIVGYTQARKEVCEEFQFRSSLPWGNTFALFADDTDDRAFAGGTVKWLYRCLRSDEERERFRGFLERDDVEIAQATIEGVFTALAEAYSARPTLSRFASTGGGAKQKRTSQGASRARAAASKNSHSPSR